jgi:hypothetical protein
MANDQLPLDLIIERYRFNSRPCSNQQAAVKEAARLAENILYIDVYGALQLDMAIGWGRHPPEYPKPREREDGVASWKPNWHIPPYEYERGIRWKPFDGMQQFDVSIEVQQHEDVYQGVVKIVAYVWDDGEGMGDGRMGCLLDIINRNREHVTLAETAKITIPNLGVNSKERINDAHLIDCMHPLTIHGFEFPPDENGDISYRKITFEPINVEQRRRDCAYRDR